MSFTVYMLKCYYQNKSMKIYTGYTNDLEKRLRKHKEGKGAKFTKYASKIELAYYETFKTKRLAMQREYFLKNDKSITRKEKLEMIKQFSNKN